MSIAEGCMLGVLAGFSAYDEYQKELRQEGGN